MFSQLRGWEILILVLIVLLLFGSKKLPDAARGIGRSLRIFKAETKGLMEDDANAEGKSGDAAPAIPAAESAQPAVPAPPPTTAAAPATPSATPAPTTQASTQPASGPGAGAAN